jgi:hypothetical protein
MNSTLVNHHSEVRIMPEAREAERYDVDPHSEAFTRRLMNCFARARRKVAERNQAEQASEHLAK